MSSRPPPDPVPTGAGAAAEPGGLEPTPGSSRPIPVLDAADSEPALERRVVTVLFADIVGFTTLAERLDSEDVAAIQDRYFALVREAVTRHGGVLEKFIGDAAMAVFGLARARDDDAERAVWAGLSIVAGMERLAADIDGLDADIGVVAPAVRVGVATGEVTRTIGAPDAGRVTGDTVNVAARLQAAAAENRVLIAESTALAVADAVVLEPLIELALKGKAAPVRAAHVSGLRPQRSRDAAMSGLRAPMLGREEELGALRAALERVRAGRHGETWLLVAPPGTGKSRLLDEFGADVAARRVRFTASDARPFGAIHDLARDVARPYSTGAELTAGLVAGGLAGGRASVVAASLWELAEPPPDPSARSLDTGPADRASRIATWLEGLTALAATPEIWLLEDLHWAGPDPLALLDAAHRGAASGSRLIVATARPGFLERLPEAWRSPAKGSEVVDLRPLAPHAAAELVHALVGDALPADLIERIVAASDGNCLFIEELLRSWVSAGVLAPGDDGWRLRADGAAVQVPTTVQAIYGGQLDDLPGESRRLARRGSVAGRRVPAPWLVEGAGGTDGSRVEAIEALNSLLRRRFLAGPHAAPPLGDAYAYRHALLRDAAYASLSRAERAALHVGFAAFIEHDLGDRVGEAAELIGMQYEAAVDASSALAAVVAPGLDRPEATRRAAAWLERAAERALLAGARAHAAELFRRTIARTDDHDTLALARLERRLGETLSEGGDMDDAIALLRAAVSRSRAAMAEAAEDSPTWRSAREALAAAGTSLAQTLQEQIHFEEAWTVADEIATEVGGVDDPPAAWLRLRAGVARSLFSDDPADVVPAAEAAIRVAAAFDDPRLDLEARTVLVAMAGLGPAETERQAAALAALAERLERPDIATRAMRIGALARADLGGDAEPLLHRAAAISADHGLLEALGWTHYARAEIAFGRGAWDLAVPEAARAIELGTRHAYHRIVVRSWYVATPIALARGDLELLRRAFAWHEAMRPHFPDSPFGRLMHRALDLRVAAAGLAEPRPPDVEWLLPSFGQEPGMASWLEAADGIVRSWLDLGLHSAAEDAVARMGAAPGERTALSQGAIELMAGRVRLARGEAADAVRMARSAAATARQAQAPWWLAKALRLIERAASATASEVAEAAEIEGRLGTVTPAP